MRFNTPIHDEQYKWFRTICYCPHWIFSVDFIYYIMRSYDLDWTPYRLDDFCCYNGMDIPNPAPKPRIYTPHRNSPFTIMMRYAVKNIIRHSILDYNMIYEILVPSDAENKLELFSKHVHKVTGKLLSKTYVTFVEILLKLTHIGRLTALFYKHGTKDCPHIVPLIISGTLLKITEDFTYAKCFNDLDAAAWLICDWFRDNDDAISDVESYDEYFDELTGEGPNDSNSKNVKEKSE